MSRPFDQLFPERSARRMLTRWGAVWTVLILAFVILGYYFASRASLQIALSRARDSFRKDVAYRSWAAQRGGVYVPLDEKTPANPYLHDIPNREITTTEGKVYTLVNPAYMTRMVHELGAAQYGLKGHLTSLNPLRPENAPDAWERSGLERFESGEREFWEIQSIDQRPYLRYLGAFLVEQGCLRCHAQQGYRLGQVRGGISVSVPLEGSWRLLDEAHERVTLLSLVVLWGVGLLAIGLVARREKQHAREQKRAVDEIQGYASQQRAMLQTTRDGFWLVDSQGRLLDVNDAYAQMSGYSREELLNLSVPDLEAQETLQDTARHLETLKVRQWDRFESRHRAKDGRVFEVEVSCSYSPADDRFVAFVRDITGENRILRSLQESELRFRTLLEGVNLVGVMLDPHGRVTYANPFLLNLSGWSLGEVLGSDWFVRFIPGDREDVRAVFNAIVQTEALLHSYENPILTRSGERREIAWNNIVLHDENGQLVGVASLGEDITSRKEAEQALRTSESLLRTFFDAVPDGIFVADGRGQYVMVNRAAEEMTGYTSEELLAKHIADLSLGDPATSRQWFESLKERAGFVHELELRRKDGTAFPALLRAARISEDLFIGLCRDISESKKLEAERRRLESEVRHAQQLESLGSLAGGIAHDMNNVLAAILGLGSLLELKVAEDPELLKTVRTILHAGARGRDLVKGLTDFARKGLQEPTLIDLNELVKREAALLQRTTLQRVELVIELAPDLPLIKGEPNALASALMNLCVNALDAMPQGGRLRLTTQRQESWVDLIVEDNGVGMSPEVQQRAMEPFFTTKAVGKGTGLGLAITYGTLKAHGGSVEIQSEVGKGTRIRLRLPVAAVDPAPTDLRGSVPAEPPGEARNLRVLLVDDDELIRESVPAMLESLGHRATVASGGLEALRRLEGGLEVDLIILDLNMPGMSGLETLDRIRLLRPEVPVMVATGFLDPGEGERIAGHPGVSVLMKPYGLRELRARLNAAP